MADGIFTSILKGVDKLVRELPEDALTNVNCSFGRGFSWISPLDALTAILYTMIYIDKDYTNKEVEFIHNYAYNKAKSEIMKEELKLKYESYKYHREDAYGKVGCSYYDYWCIRYYIKIIVQEQFSSIEDIESFLKIMIELMFVEGITPCKLKYVYGIGEEFFSMRLLNIDIPFKHELDLKRLYEFIEHQIQKKVPNYSIYDSYLPKDDNDYY